MQTKILEEFVKKALKKMKKKNCEEKKTLSGNRQKKV
jgi:hypothetical protein